MPILRRIPKRGFTPPFPLEMAIVNVSDLDQIFKPNSEVTPELLYKEGMVNKRLPIKVLGDGDLKKPLKVSAQSFSKQAKEKIVAAGGSVQIIPIGKN
jgi:large subunit ribosomal protein L15